MKRNKNLSQFPPLVFNVFKPARMSSYDVVRHFKRHLPEGFGKIGHFGTLDPFACGVLMIGISGAARLNDLIHEFLPKTYLAIGKLGIETPTGDYTSEISQKDESIYLHQEISRFSEEFIEERIRDKFLGEYWQSPHQYSATKFMGKNLHEWAREGVEIKKEAVRRFVYDIRVVKYRFPYLSVRFKVSSGTYIRTLFSDISHYLGTLGSLIALVRESVGPISTESALTKRDWPMQRSSSILDMGIQVEQVLPFSSCVLDEQDSLRFKNGAFLKRENLQSVLDQPLKSSYIWIKNNELQLLGLAEELGDGTVRPKINFSSGPLVSP
jgi:tRNA pseudouridine55 synthase